MAGEFGPDTSVVREPTKCGRRCSYLFRQRKSTDFRVLHRRPCINHIRFDQPITAIVFQRLNTGARRGAAIKLQALWRREFEGQHVFVLHPQVLCRGLFSATSSRILMTTCTRCTANDRPIFRMSARRRQTEQLTLYNYERSESLNFCSLHVKQELKCQISSEIDYFSWIIIIDMNQKEKYSLT